MPLTDVEKLFLILILNSDTAAGNPHRHIFERKWITSGESLCSPEMIIHIQDICIVIIN